MKNVITLVYGQKVSFPFYAHTKFTVGSIEGYASEYNESTTEALERNAANAKENPYTDYCIAWISPDAGVISADQSRRDQTAAEYEAARKNPLNVGDHVRIEGRIYEIETAANNNIFLRPVGEAAYGHPTRNRYPGKKVA